MKASDNSNVNFSVVKCSITNYLVTSVSGSIGVADNILKVKFEVGPEGMLIVRLLVIIV